MFQIDSHKIGQHAGSNHARFYPYSCRATVSSIIEQKRSGRRELVSDKHTAALVTHARGILGPAQLFNGIEACIAIGADSERNVRRDQIGVGSDTVTQIALGGWADTDGTAIAGQQRYFCRTGMGGMNDGG